MDIKLTTQSPLFMFKDGYFSRPRLFMSCRADGKKVKVLNGMSFINSVLFLLIGEACGHVTYRNKDRVQRNEMSIYQNKSLANYLQSTQLYTSSERSPLIWTGENRVIKILTDLIPAKDTLIESRRLPFMMPVMYNLGVITTLLVVLTFLMFKGLTLGIIILILNLNAKGFKHQEALSTGPIHIHVHGGSKKPYPAYSYYTDPWERTDEDTNNTSLEQLFHPRAFRR